MIYNALLCCLLHAAGRRGHRFAMGQQKVIGPQGGCVGIGEAEALIAIAASLLRALPASSI
ncbi:hypothetical protein OOK13_44750 [Streptomyces sp. NBC_00378]|uniref:hypothetical protein n=1 Tax=unclassified Streptomyces TaxID=2593676 RepID=UPI00225825A3|nr:MULTISPECIES: hypothetical protein [unclassified Streptomyces]MCX5115414.1 hypothetical protein [Streptomyces sp. NBC_00378]